MSRTVIVAALIFACVPVIAFGQSKTPQSSPPCCGETEPSMQFASLQEELLYSQLNIQAYLLTKTKSTKLVSGVHLISASSGYKFQATVGRNGVVSSWYITDPSGHQVARVNASGNNGDTEVNLCMQKFIDRVALIDTWTFLSRVQYGQQIWQAWGAFLTCLKDMGHDAPQ